MNIENTINKCASNPTIDCICWRSWICQWYKLQKDIEDYDNEDYSHLSTWDYIYLTNKEKNDRHKNNYWMEWVLRE